MADERLLLEDNLFKGSSFPCKDHTRLQSLSNVYQAFWEVLGTSISSYFCKGRKVYFHCSDRRAIITGGFFLGGLYFLTIKVGRNTTELKELYFTITTSPLVGLDTENSSFVMNVVAEVIFLLTMTDE